MYYENSTEPRGTCRRFPLLIPSPEKQSVGNIGNCRFPLHRAGRPAFRISEQGGTLMSRRSRFWASMGLVCFALGALTQSRIEDLITCQTLDEAEKSSAGNSLRPKELMLMICGPPSTYRGCARLAVFCSAALVFLPGLQARRTDARARASAAGPYRSSRPARRPGLLQRPGFGELRTRQITSTS